MKMPSAISSWFHTQDGWAEQDKLVKLFLAISVFVHFLLFVFGGSLHFSGPRMLDEIAIETDLVTDDDFKPSSKTVIPKAKPAEKPSVPSNMLPQINKDFAIKQPQKEEEGLIADEKADVIPEGKKEEVKAEDTKVQEEDKATQLAKLDALKRLALEKLRQEQKEKSKELKAHEADELAQVKEALHKEKGLKSNVGSGLLSQAANKMYGTYLKKAIRKNWALPKTFQVTNADMMATLDIIINARGELVSVKVNSGSGDSTFDQYCVNAVKNSSPFKSPPQAQAGEVITLNCIP